MLSIRFASRSCWRPLLLYQEVRFSYVPSYPYIKMEKDFSPQYWKIRDLGSNFRNETPQVVASVHYYYTKKSNNKLNVIPSNKKRERLFIVVCVKVAVNRLLLLGKIKTIGLIFSHETAGLLASFTTISKSLSNLNLWVNIFHSFFWVNYNV